MATARSVSNLAIVVSADTGGVDHGLNKAEQSVKKFGSGAIGGALGNLFGGKIGGAGGLIGGILGGPGGAVAGASIGTLIDSTFSTVTASLHAGVTGISEIVKQLLHVGGEYEMAIAAFSAATGSDEKGKSIFKGIQQLGVATIFTSEQLSQQARILMGYGIAADKVVPTLTKLALIAQKSGRGESGLAGAVLAFSQVRTLGHLQGQERRQLSEAGIGAAELAKTMGVTEQQFEDMLHAGQVGFDVVARTINRMGTEAESTSEKFNRTMKGSFNAVKETAENTFGEIGMGMIRAFGIPDAALKIATLLQELPAKAAQLEPVFTKLRTLIEPIAKALYAGFSVVFKAGEAFIGTIIPSMKDAQTYAENIGKHLARGIGTAIDLALSLGEKLLMAFLPIAGIIDTAAKLITDVKLPSLQQGTITALAGIASAKGAAGPGGFRGMALDLFKEGLPNVEAMAPNLDKSGADEGVKGIAPAVRELAKSINENALTGKGQNPFVDFQTNFGNLMAAEQNGLIQSRAGADAFLFAEFKKLTGSMAKIENTLPAAIDRNTVEGQARIEKIIANTQQRGMDDVPGLLRQAAETARQQLVEQKRVVDELRRLNPQIPINVG